MTKSVERPDVRIFDGGIGLVLVGIGAAAVGGLVLALGWAVDPERTFLAYLVAYAAVMFVCVGALMFLMTVYAMNATWPTVVRRPLEALASGVIPLALLFVPIAVGLQELYIWVQPIDDELPRHVAELISKKRPWLRDGFFHGRSALYLASWVTCAVTLRRWSLRQDEDPRFESQPKSRALSAGMLPLVALTTTFAAFDWIMALDPAWFSTMFGIYLYGSGTLGALCVLTLMVARLERTGWLRELIRRSHYYALGRLLLTFVVFWAYAVYFQFFLIWMANKPNEVVWYIDRVEGVWGWLAALLIFVHFVIPFVFLLSYRLKRTRRALMLVAGWLLVAHYIHMHWIIVPSHRHAVPLHWADPAAALFVIGLTVAFVTASLRNHPIVPKNDTTLSKALEYDSD
jgi:hypothetical protein